MKKLISILMIVCLAVSLLPAQENVFTHKVGNAEIILLSEIQGTGRENILIGATPEMRRETIPGGTFANATNAFLIKTPEKTILMDAGYGTKLFDNLKSQNVTKEQINMVLITHMHGDHIGGMLIDGKVAFPNAELYLPQPEHDYWMSDEMMNKVPENRRGGFQKARDVIAAYKSKLHLFQPSEIGEKGKLLDGISGIAAYGHTPGHTAYLFESGKDKILIWGDLTHAMAIQMPYPQVAVTYDVNPEDAVIYRKRILEYVSKNKIPIAGMHIAFPAMGKLTGNKKGGYLFAPFK